MYEDPICVSHAKPTVAYGRVSCIARAPAAAVADAIWELQLVKASVPFDYYLTPETQYHRRTGRKLACKACRRARNGLEGMKQRRSRRSPGCRVKVQVG